MQRVSQLMEIHITHTDGVVVVVVFANNILSIAESGAFRLRARFVLARSGIACAVALSWSFRILFGRALLALSLSLCVCGFCSSGCGVAMFGPDEGDHATTLGVIYAL